MSLPEGLDKLLRAAYAAGASGETSARHALERTLARIESMDATQSGVYGQAAKDFLTHVRNSLGRCPRCGHAPHGSWCANMASDNDCNCTYDPAAEWVADLEVGDKLSAIADLDDATAKDLPSLHKIGTPVRFAEGEFYVQTVSRNGDGTTVDLVDASRYLEARMIPPTSFDPMELGPETYHFGAGRPGNLRAVCGAHRDEAITSAPDRVSCKNCQRLIGSEAWEG